MNNEEEPRESIIEYISSCKNNGNSKWIQSAKLCIWNPPSREYYEETNRQFKKRSRSSRYQKEFCKSIVQDCMRKYDIDFMILTDTDTKTPLKEVIELFDIVFSTIFDLEIPEYKEEERDIKERKGNRLDVLERGLILTSPPNCKAYCLKIMPEVRLRINQSNLYGDNYKIQKSIRELESYEWPSFSKQSIQVIGAKAPTLPIEETLRIPDETMNSRINTKTKSKMNKDTKNIFLSIFLSIISILYFLGNQINEFIGFWTKWIKYV
jgi:hypothetical protein